MPEQIAGRRAELILKGWPIALAMFGIFAIGAGAIILVDGPAGTTLPLYSQITLLPWWAWGTSAVVGGSLILIGGYARDVGLAVMTLWWALRWSLLTAGVVMVGPPRVGIATYGLLVAAHVLIASVETLPVVEMWLRRARARATHSPVR